MTAEVVVVDDASRDGTAEAAAAADDGTGRLRVIRLPVNAGPSAARNTAIRETTAPILAILDADDHFVPGRLGRLLRHRDWDVIADDILFVGEGGSAPELPDVRRDTATCSLDLEAFVRGNLSRGNRHRRELGFLHPLMSRDFLAVHGLAYDERLRLGEDYDLYARALASGARFRLVDTVGYVAMERANSLSAAHGTEDLRNLAAADDRLLSRELSPGAAAAIRAHRRQIIARHRLRAFLDARATRGALVAAALLSRRPHHLPAVAGGVARDKWRAFRRGNAARRLGERPERLFGPGFAHAPLPSSILAAAPRATAPLAESPLAHTAPETAGQRR
jgi:succinoglycan biosynthesis protein ExoU